MKTSPSSVLKFIKIVLWINLIIFVASIVKTLHLWFTINFIPDNIPLETDSNLLKISKVSSGLFHLMTILYIIFNLISTQLFIKSLKLIHLIKLHQNFNVDILSLMMKITKLSFFVAILDISLNLFTEIILNSVLSLNIDVTSSGFLIFSAILFIFTYIYKQGVELKAENDLTI